jgi:hypothetical protein
VASLYSVELRQLNICHNHVEILCSLIAAHKVRRLFYIHVITSPFIISRYMVLGWLICFMFALALV